MSRKDYVAVAEIIRAANVTDEQRRELAARFADLFALDNPRFRRDLFICAATQ